MLYFVPENGWFKSPEDKKQFDKTVIELVKKGVPKGKIDAWINLIKLHSAWVNCDYSDILSIRKLQPLICLTFSEEANRNPTLRDNFDAIEDVLFSTLQSLINLGEQHKGKGSNISKYIKEIRRNELYMCVCGLYDALKEHLKTKMGRSKDNQPNPPTPFDYLYTLLNCLNIEAFNVGGNGIRMAVNKAYREKPPRDEFGPKYFTRDENGLAEPL